MDLKLENLLADVMRIPVETVTKDLEMKDLEAWDSLKHMELIATVENAFGLELTFDEIVNMQSVGNIKRVLEKRGIAS